MLPRKTFLKRFTEAFLNRTCHFCDFVQNRSENGHFRLISSLSILGVWRRKTWRGLDLGHWSGETWLAGVGAYYGQLRVQEGGGRKVRSSMNWGSSGGDDHRTTVARRVLSCMTCVMICHEISGDRIWHCRYDIHDMMWHYMVNGIVATSHDIVAMT